MSDEFRHHIELRTADLMHAGLPPREAARRAKIEFGPTDAHKERARAARGLAVVDRLSVSWLDVKLGIRMLAKYPGLSLVGVIGMAVAIAIGAGYFAAISTMVYPSLPLDRGDRVVSIHTVDVRTGSTDRRSVHNFVRWREDLRSVEDLSAFRVVARNLLVDGRSAELVEVAEMTASGFRVARVSPVLGRPLLEEDQREGSPDVIVIAYEEWQRLFDGDPDILGKAVRLGDRPHTVVGVMPEGYRFPLRERYWTPLRVDAAAHPPGDGPSLYLFGRLSDGASFESARAELAALTERVAAADPATYGHLRGRILPYAHPFIGIDSPAMAIALRSFQMAIGFLLVLVSVNVAVLVYARTATRAGEIAVRSALGASRRRVVAQLFAEALVLSLVAAALGLTLAGVALTKVGGVISASENGLPFWFDLGITPGVALYVATLAVLASIVIGVLPALKATGRRTHAGLKQLTAIGARLELGRTWTLMIVTQVGVAVAVLPFALYVAGVSLERATARPGYAADEIVSASLSIEREEPPPASQAAEYERAVTARYLTSAGELIRRIEAEPAAAGVTYARHFPGYERFGRIEIEEASGEPRKAGWARVNQVAPEFFGVFDVPILTGRGFIEADTRSGAATVIVDRVFAENVLDGGDVLGRRIRRVVGRVGGDSDATEVGPWMEVVGVVPAFAIETDFDPANPRLYEPIPFPMAAAVRCEHSCSPEEIGFAMTLAVRVRGARAQTFITRVREMATAVDPALQLLELRTAGDIESAARRTQLYIAFGVIAVALSVLLLSAAGVYAMMSFTVTRRRREIGIRSALGANPRRILRGVLARAAAQLGAGALLGLGFAATVDRLLGGGPITAKGMVLLPAVAALVILVGLASTLVPARRALAVEPTEALRAE